MSYVSTEFRHALRPFSLVVALATCSLGISLAYAQGIGNAVYGLLVLCAGLLLQAAVNLINDLPDLAHARFDGEQRKAVRRNAHIGVACIVAACAIGLWFVSFRGWPMALLGLIGVVGLWSYADGPLNFKARGLGFLAVFFLTGLLMVEGAFYALSGYFSAAVAFMALPFSFFASLLLLANELRDYERDVIDGHGTFTVRAGFSRGVALYRLLACAVGLCTVALALTLGPQLLLLALVSLLLLLAPLRRLEGDAAARLTLPRLTGRCYFAYSLLFIVCLWVPSL